jgi:hypothetical protein
MTRRRACATLSYRIYMGRVRRDGHELPQGATRETVLGMRRWWLDGVAGVGLGRCKNEENMGWWAKRIRLHT